jgi:hypothetical protein
VFKPAEDKLVADAPGILLGRFVALESCPSAESCAESYTLTFTRIRADARSLLELD